MKETALIASGFKKQLDDLGYFYFKCIGDIELITQSSDFVENPEDWFVQFYEFGSITITSSEDLDQLIKVLERNIMHGDSKLEVTSIQN